MENKKGIIYVLEEIKEGDDSLILYSRKIGDKNLAIIPKSRAKVFETDTTYVVEFTYNPQLA